jgi:hypothetical protein
MMLGHEYVLHPDSLAKYAAAFFRMSRSSLVRLSSALSRETSLRKLAVSPLPNPCCSRASRTHRYPRVL